MKKQYLRPVTDVYPIVIEKNFMESLDLVVLAELDESDFEDD